MNCEARGQKVKVEIAHVNTQANYEVRLAVMKQTLGRAPHSAGYLPGDHEGGLLCPTQVVPNNKAQKITMRGFKNVMETARGCPVKTIAAGGRLIPAVIK